MILAPRVSDIREAIYSGEMTGGGKKKGGEREKKIERERAIIGDEEKNVSTAFLIM